MGLSLAAALAVVGGTDPTDHDDADDADDAGPIPGDPSRAGGEPDGAAAFVDAWERQRLGTFVVESVYVREASAGGRAESPTSVAQRPPDRVSIGAGSLSGRLDGYRVACAADAAGLYRCRRGARLQSYEEAVATELGRLRDLVVGPEAPYAVADRGDGCFELQLRPGGSVQPYGRRARFCFDEATGAAVEVEIVRDTVVDRTVATSVRGEVTDADLALPEAVASG